MKMHIAQSGANSGSLVDCPAKISCRIGNDDEHVYLNSPEEAKEYDSLVLAEEYGGSFGGGLTHEQTYRLKALKAQSATGKLRYLAAKRIEGDAAIAKYEEEIASYEKSMYRADYALNHFQDHSADQREGLISDSEHYEELIRDNRKAINSILAPRATRAIVSRDDRPEYIASIDSKHFDATKHGSTFTSASVKRTEDVLETAYAQRGNLDGDDREELIKAGADPASFLPPETGVRYLKVKTPGTQALRDTSNMEDDEVLTIVEKGGNDGRPSSLSFVSDVNEQPKTNFGTIVIGPNMDANKKPIPNTEVLWTTHPGIPTRGIRSDSIREKGLAGGSQITVGELRKKFGKDIQVNTRLIS